MKNIKKYFWVALSLATFTLLSSCYGEPDQVSKESEKISFGKYLQDMSVLKGKGTILLQSNEFEATQNTEKNITISQREGNENQIKLYEPNNKIISINDYNSQIDFKRSLFGKQISCDIKGKAENIYIPKLLKLEYSSTSINGGSTINWNADLNNKKGVVIWLSYSPLDQRDFKLLAEHRKIITYGVTTDDNGSYTLTSQDLERFPKNAVLNLNIARTNYIINTTDLPSFVAFTTVNKNVGYYTN